MGSVGFVGFEEFETVLGTDLDSVSEFVLEPVPGDEGCEVPEILFWKKFRRELDSSDWG